MGRNLLWRAFPLKMKNCNQFGNCGYTEKDANKGLDEEIKRCEKEREKFLDKLQRKCDRLFKIKRKKIIIKDLWVKNDKRNS